MTDASAPPRREPTRTDLVPAEGGEFDLHLWLPEAGHGPALLLVQEIFGVGAYTDRSPDELTALAKNNLQPRGLIAGFGGRIALTDGRSTSRTSAVRSAYLDIYPRSGSPPCSSSPRPRRRSAQPSASAG